MKRLSIFLCIMALLSFGLFAEDAVLISFNDLAEVNADGYNEATMIDFSNEAGTSFTEAEKELMKVSLALDSWEVLLASSSRTVANQAYSLTKSAEVARGDYAGEYALGVRIHFPEEPFNSWAIVRPPFEIPAYYGNQFDGKGVVKNVGVIKSISLEIMGKNFPHGVGVVLKDQNGVEQTVFMGYLDFDGWKTITWTNPNYITDVRNRELVKYPLYPRSTPSYKLVGIVFYRDANAIGGDFITYLREIRVTYDKAILNLEGDVDDEALWNILTDREEDRRTAEFSRLGNIQVLRALEKSKMHSDESEAAAGE